MTEASKTRIGVVHAHPKGFGFASDGATEVFIPPTLMKELIPGDKIVFETCPGKVKGSLQVVSPLIVERPESVWVGTLRIENGYCYLCTDEPCFVGIEVKDITYCHPEQVVSVRIAGFQSSGTRGQPRVTGKLERILGEDSRSGFHLHYAMAKFDFQEGFPPLQLQKEALRATDTPREDLRSTPFITIDSAESRDLDDALWAQVTSTGFEVYVAISDVSAFIPEGSPLDKVAYRRGTSLYLPGLTVPMLPEVLSNELCSLVEGKDRFAVVVRMRLDREGTLQSFRFDRAVMASRKRLTYDEVLAWREGAFTSTDEIDSSLCALWALFEKLAAKRKQRGQLEFLDKEPKLVVEDGQQKICWTTRHNAHKLVEELMLLTNHAVAAQIHKHGKKALYRHQPRPDGEKWVEFQRWVTANAYPELADEPCMRSISNLLQHLHAPQQVKAEFRLKGAMQPAYYEAEQSSHFSLGYPQYTHFTSPIRRYADLLVHRLLLGNSTLTAEELAKRATHCSHKAKQARMAERGVWDRLKKNALLGFDSALTTHLVSQSGHGVRVFSPDAQCTLYVPSKSLHAMGLAFNSQLKSWGAGSNFLEPGSEMVVKLIRAESDRKKVELFAELLSVSHY